MDNSSRATMLIRRPPAAVFNAFVQPSMLRKFWLSYASGPLAPGATVTWEFMVPGAKDRVTVTHFEQPRQLSLRWSDGSEVSMTFEPYGHEATRAVVKVSGFTGDRALSAATTTIEGYAIVLCDLKTLLESGRSANLVRDKAELIAKH